VVLLGGGRTFETRGLEEGSSFTEAMAFKEILEFQTLLPSSLSFFLASGHHEVNRTPSLHSPSIMHYVPIDPKLQPSDHTLKPLKPHKINLSFFQVDYARNFII
jgi:hypothetical protein